MKATWLPAAVVGERWSAQVINHQTALDSLGTHKVVPLGDLCQIESGQYLGEYVERAASDGVTPYIRVDNIRPFVANMNVVDLAYVRRDPTGVLPRSVIRAGDVVIARTGTLGKASLAVSELVGCIMSQHITRLTIREEQRSKVTPECLCAFLNSTPGRTQLLAGGSGSTRLELTHARLSAIHVPLIDSTHQDELTLLVRRGTESLAKGGQLIRQAVDRYNSAFRVGEPGSGFRSNWVESARVVRAWPPRVHCLASDGWLADVPGNYEVVPLGTVADTVRGKGTRSADYVRSGIPFVRTTSLINGSIDPFPDHHASPETYTRYRQQTQEGDLLLSIEGKIGQVAYLTDLDRCVFKNHIELIRPKDRSHSAHLFLALASEVGQAQMRKLTVVQATLPGLASRSRQVLVPLPRAGEAPERVGGPLAEALRFLQEGLRQRVAGLQALSSAASLVNSILS
jgi:type I restriction enzyme S subunit